MDNKRREELEAQLRAELRSRRKPRTAEDRRKQRIRNYMKDPLGTIAESSQEFGGYCIVPPAQRQEGGNPTAPTPPDYHTSAPTGRRDPQFVRGSFPQMPEHIQEAWRTPMETYVDAYVADMQDRGGYSAIPQTPLRGGSTPAPGDEQDAQRAGQQLAAWRTLRENYDDADLYNFASAFDGTLASDLDEDDITRDYLRGLISSYSNPDGSKTFAANGVPISQDRATAERLMDRYYEYRNHDRLMEEDPEYRNRYIHRISNGMSPEQYRDQLIDRYQQQLDEIAEESAVENRPAWWQSPTLSGPGFTGHMSDNTEQRKIDDLRETLRTLRSNDDWWKALGSGFAESFNWEDLATYGIGSINADLSELRALQKYQGAIKRNPGKNAEEVLATLDPSDRRLVRLSRLKQEVDSSFQLFGGRSTASSVGHTLGFTPSFMAQMAATGGLGNALAGGVGLGREAAEKITLNVVRDAFNRSVWSGLKKSGLKVGRHLGYGALSAAAQAPLSSMTYQNYVDRTRQQYEYTADGMLEFSPTSAWGRGYRALMDTWAEYFSEGSEGVFSFATEAVGRKAAKLLFLDRAIHDGQSNLRGFWKNHPGLNAVRRRLKITGPIEETLSESLGDLVAPLVTGETERWDEMATTDYWWTMALSMSTMSAGFFAMSAPFAAQYAKRDVGRLRNNRDYSIGHIESEPLREMLWAAMSNDGITDQANTLSSFDWKSVSNTDKGHALDFIQNTLALEILQSEEAESRRLAKFEPVIRAVTNSVYRGTDVMHPDFGGSLRLVTATLPSGEVFRVVGGDYNSPEGVFYIRRDDGKLVPSAVMPGIKFTETKLDEFIAEQYAMLFSSRIDQERLQSMSSMIQDAANSAMPTRLIDHMITNKGYALYSPGDAVALTDGVSGVVNETLGGGRYVVERADGNMVEVGFLDVLQPNAQVATAQVEMANGAEQATPAEPLSQTAAVGDGVVFGDKRGIVTGVNADGTYIVRTADDAYATVRHGDISQITPAIEIGNAEDFLIDNAAAAEVATTAQAAAAEAGAPVEAPATANQKVVPRTESGDIDYENIADPEMMAVLYTSALGSPEAAIGELEFSILGKKSMIEQLQTALETQTGNDTERMRLRGQIALLEQKISIRNLAIEQLTGRPSAVEVADAVVEAAAETEDGNNVAENIPENGNIDTGNIPTDEQVAEQQPSAKGERRRQANLSDTSRRQPNYPPREEIDENGHPFVVSSDGTTIFGEITDDTGLPSAPIKLSEGVVDENGNGYGLQHIEVRHGEQIRNAGFKSVEDFVKYVAENYDKDNIKVGKKRVNGSGTFIIQIEDEHANLLYIELSHDGSYWNVNSGGVFRKGYSEKRKNVELNTELSTSDTASSDKPFVQTDSEDGSRSADTHSDNQRFSNNKGTTTDPKLQEESAKSAHANIQPVGNTDKLDGTPSEEEASPAEGITAASPVLQEAEQAVDTNPSEGQKMAGNYRKGHVKIDGLDITIENPKGSVRSGVDRNAKPWSVVMNNTYGYIRGTKGKDADQIDIFLSDNIEDWNGEVYVVDQVKPDGSFDEHKVMYGFSSIDEAEQAYLANYSKDWKGLGSITGVSKDDFKVWINSSKRKVKPFSEYKSIAKLEGQSSNEAQATPERQEVKANNEGLIIPPSNRKRKPLTIVTPSKTMFNLPINLFKYVSKDKINVTRGVLLDSDQYIVATDTGVLIAIRAAGIRPSDVGKFIDRKMQVVASAGLNWRPVIIPKSARVDFVIDFESIAKEVGKAPMKEDRKKAVRLNLGDRPIVLPLERVVALSDFQGAYGIGDIRYQEFFDAGKIQITTGSDMAVAVGLPQNAIDSWDVHDYSATPISKEGEVAPNEAANTNSKKISLEGYLGRLGLSSPLSDFMLDKQRLPNLKTQGERERFEREAGQAANEYAARRQAAIDEYMKLVEAGEIVAPSTVDRALVAANGHEDLDSTKAARNILTKRGIDWRTGDPIDTELKRLTADGSGIPEEVSPERWNALVDHLKSILGTENVITDPEVMRAIYDEVMGTSGDARFMGSKVDARMADVEAQLQGRELTDEQRAVVNVFGGKSDNLIINLKDATGNVRRIVMRQGNEMNAGAKHSLFRHYGTDTGVITAEDITLIPEVITKGERTEKPRGNRTVIEYRQEINGIKYSVLTEINARREAFADFYTNKKTSPAARKTRSEEARDTADNVFSGKGSENFENPTIKLQDLRQSIFGYHGSGAKFKKFDRTAIGSGQAAQAYGYGFYITEVEGNAKRYASARTEERRAELEQRISTLEREISGARSSINELKQRQSNTKFSDPVFKILDNAISWEQRRIEEAERIKARVEKLIAALEEIPQYVYKISIPDDTGGNYLPFSGQIGEGMADRINRKLSEITSTFTSIGSMDDGLSAQRKIAETLGVSKNSKEVSDLLSSVGFVGISYPAQYTLGGRTDGAKNYVIFNSEDAEITETTRLFKTAQGEVYGFTVGGKIYLDPTRMTVEAPIHEYVELWSAIVARENPALWERGKRLITASEMWQQVNEDPNYRNASEDARVSEALSRIVAAEAAGEAKKISSAKHIVSGIRSWLKKFWGYLKQTFSSWSSGDLDALTLDEFIKLPLRDFVEGINISDYLRADGAGARLMFIGEQGARALDQAGEANRRLDNLEVAREMEADFEEREQRLEKLRDAKPVEIAGNEIEPSEDLEQYRKHARAHANQLRGEYTNADTGAVVEVNRNSIKETLHHDYKEISYLASVAAIPQIIENGIFITSEHNSGNKHIERFDYYVTGLRIGKVDYTVKFVVSIQRDGSRYYDHKLTQIEKGRLLDLSAISSTESANKAPISEVKDKRLLDIIQTDPKENAKKIKMATGWERGADGKWRYETKDPKINEEAVNRLKGELSYQKQAVCMLTDLFERGSEIFSAYPDLQKLRVVVRKGESVIPEGQLEWADEPYDRQIVLSEAVIISHFATDALEMYSKSDRNIIRVKQGINPRTGEAFESADEQHEALSRYTTAADEWLEKYRKYSESRLRAASRILAHEVQHAVQFMEGFARGANVEEFQDLRMEVLRSLNFHTDGSLLDGSAISDAQSLREALSKEVLPGVPLKEAYTHNLQRAARRFGYKDIDALVDDYANLPSAFEQYRRTAGEVEARNVQKRHEMTPGDRQQTLAVETEDVARKDQIFLKENMAGRYQGSFRPQIFGGNSGYIGYSMSKNAAEARSEGRYPKTDFKRFYKIPQKSLDALVKAGVINNSEWHHTGPTGNKTTFYGWENQGALDYYRENKAEIDRVIAAGEDLSRHIAGFDSYIGRVFDVEVKRYQDEAEAKKMAEESARRQRESLNAYLATVIPDPFVATNGVEVRTKGNLDPTFNDWEAYLDGERLSKRNGKAERNTAFEELREQISQARNEYEKVLSTRKLIEQLFNQAISGELKGRPISIGRLTADGRAYLEQISGVSFKNKVDFVLNPSDLAHVYKRHFGENEKDGRNIPLTIEDIRNIVDVISTPNIVIYSVEKGQQERKMFSFLKEAEQGTYNLLEIYADRKGNLTAKSFYKTKEGVSQRAMTLSKSLHTTSETDGATLNVDAKIPQMFEFSNFANDFSFKLTENENRILDEENDIRYRRAKQNEYNVTPETYAEMVEIREAARRNGTFMLAPNGEPTNLSERQWLQVRTRAFKAWFGDWEKVARVEKLRKSRPVEISEDAHIGKYELDRKSAESYLLENLRGEYTILDTGDKVTIARRGAQKVLSHSAESEAHLRSIVAIPQLLEQSIFIEEEKPDKPNAKYDAYRYYVCGVNIGDTSYTARITIGVKQGKYYYDHSLTDIEKGNLIEIANGFTPNGGRTLPPYAESKDTRIIPLLQTNASKVVDANGEPLVVYHGTPNEFSIFDKTKQGTSTDRGIWGNGFYFTSDMAYAGTYKSRFGRNGQTLSLFLNIKNPLIVDTADINNEGKRLFSALYDKYFTDDVFEDASKADANMQNANRRMTDALIGDGYDGVAITYGRATDEYVAFEPNQIKSATENDGRFSDEENDIRYRRRSGDIFYSNAEEAVWATKQEKATPEQWLNMLQKSGGLKAGEDKWIGLSEWLRSSEKKTLSKQEVLEYIAQNKIQIEETTYSDERAIETTPEFKALHDRYRTLRQAAEEASQQRFDDFVRQMEVKYGFPEDAFDTTVLSETEYNIFASRRNDITNAYIDAWSTLHDEYGDDFDKAFLVSPGGMWVNNSEDAMALLGLEGDNPINSTRAGLTTKGLEGLREIALTVPTIEPWGRYDEIHFGDAGGGRAIAWIRFGETLDADGNRVLVIDEIQSKRHQEARTRGYKTREWAEKAEEINRAEEDVANATREVREYRDTLKEKYNYEELTQGLNIKESTRAFMDAMTEEERARYTELHINYTMASARLNELREEIPGRDLDRMVPEAPFEKNWAELAMKRMLRYAAENGFDKIAWTTGQQQAERYDLSKQIDAIGYRTLTGKNGEQRYNVSAYKDGNTILNNIYDSVAEIERDYGKEIARKIMDGEGEKSGSETTLSGLDLKVGGQGMRGFYDKMLVDFMNKYGKRWGVKVGEVTMPRLQENNTMHAVEVTDAMHDSVMEGQLMFRSPFIEVGLTPRYYLEEAYRNLLQNANKDPNFAERINKILERIREYDAHDFVAETYEADPFSDEHLKAVSDVVYDLQREYGIPNQVRVVRDLADFTISVARFYGYTIGREEALELSEELFVSYNQDGKRIEANAIHVRGIDGGSGEIIIRADVISNKRIAGKNLFHEWTHAINDRLREEDKDYLNLFNRFRDTQDLDQTRHVLRHRSYKIGDDMVGREVGANERLAHAIDAMSESGRLDAYLNTEEASSDYIRQHLDIRTKAPEDLKELILICLSEIKRSKYDTSRDDGSTPSVGGYGPRNHLGRVQGNRVPRKEDEISSDVFGTVSPRGGVSETRSLGNERGGGLPQGAERGGNIDQRHADLSRLSYPSYISTLERLSVRFGVPVEVVEDTSLLRGNARDAKGWYVPSTGKVVVVLPNNTSVEDVEATFLHEVVAHMGLRKLLGAKFRAFIEAVWSVLPTEKQQELLRQHRTDRMDIAAEEYLAEVAETGDITPGLWSRIVGAIRKFFRDVLGVPLRISEKDIRYMLYLSKHNLESASDNIAKVRILTDQRFVRDRLNRLYRPAPRLRYDDKNLRFVDVSTSERVWDKIYNFGALSWEALKSLPNTVGKNFRRSFQDRMIKYKRLQDSLKEMGVPIDYMVDFYNAENHFTSRAAVEVERFRRRFVQPMLDAMHLISERTGLDFDNISDYVAAETALERHESGANAVSKDKTDPWNFLYVSGLIRTTREKIADSNNKIFSEEGFAALTEEEKAIIPAEIVKKFEKDGYSALNGSERFAINEAVINLLWRNIREVTDRTLEYFVSGGLKTREGVERVKGHGWKYYTPLFDFDEKFENMNDPSEIFEFVSKKTSRRAGVKIYKAEGRKTKPSNPIISMVNLGERVILASRNNEAKQSLLRLLRRAEKQLGEQVTEDIWRMDKVYYYSLHDETGKTHWVKTTDAPSPEDLEKARELRNKIVEIKLKLREISNDLKSLQVKREDTPEYRAMQEATRIWQENGGGRELYAAVMKAQREYEGTVKPYAQTRIELEKERRDLIDELAKFESEETIKTTAGNFDFSDETPLANVLDKQRVVEVYENGTLIQIKFRDPEIANAINGEMSSQFAEYADKLLNKTFLGNITRWRAAAVTSMSPDFLVRNGIRDFLHAVLMHLVDAENGQFKLFLKHYGRKLRTSWRGAFGTTNPLTIAELGNLSVLNPQQRVELIAKYGTNRVYDTLYDYFLSEGGQTGFVHVRKVEHLERDMRRSINSSRTSAMRLSRAAKWWRWVADSYNAINSAVEDTTRFATFVANIDAGKGVFDAVTQAKNITTNFNRKGELTGALGTLYMFINPSIQGTAQLASVATRNPRRFTAVALVVMGLGYLCRMIKSWTTDEDEENNLYAEEIPEYLYDDNAIIPVRWAGKRWIFGKVPMPNGWRFLWNWGAILARVHIGEYDSWTKVCGDLTDALLSETLYGYSEERELLRAVIPTIAQPFYDIAHNKDAFGRPIHRDDKFNSYLPDSELGNRNVNTAALVVAQSLNAAAGGNQFRAAGVRDDGTVNKFLNAFDVNPSNLEYIVSEFAGGTIYGGKLAVQFWRMGAAVDEDIDFELRNIPMLNTILGTSRAPRPNADYYDRDRNIDRMATIYDRQLEAGHIAKGDPGYTILVRKKAVFDSYKKQIARLMHTRNKYPIDSPFYNKFNEQAEHLMRVVNRVMDRMVFSDDNWQEQAARLHQRYYDAKFMERIGTNSNK